MDAELNDTQKNISWNEKVLHTLKKDLNQDQYSYSFWFL